MKHSVSKIETKVSRPVAETIPLMANVTVPLAAKAKATVPPKESIEITGAIERGLNVVNITYYGRGPASVRLSTKALRAFLRLVVESKLRGGKSIVTALDLQREGVLPWGTACTGMTEVFESIATVLGGDVAEELLDIWLANPEDQETPWERVDWDVHLQLRFDLFGELENGLPSSGSTIRQRLGRMQPPCGDKAFLRANGWRPDFAYLHGDTSSSKKTSPDGVTLGYRLKCSSGSLRYNRAALLRHDDIVVRQLAALLPAILPANLHVQ
jgi:hypothetical protein